MRVLVYPHDMNLGGSQLNAIEIAAAVRDKGHEVLVFGQPGQLTARVRELGLEFVAAPEPGRRPSGVVVRNLRSLVKDRGIDVLHGYEWPPALECVLGARGTSATAVATVMSMAVAPFIPRDLPLVVGTAQIAHVERGRGRSNVNLLEPPVDLVANGPHLGLDDQRQRAAYGVSTEAFLIVVVSRLAHQLKLEGLLSAIRTIPTLGPHTQLLIVGDGPARREVAAAARQANRLAGREAVLVAGEREDPRPAYAIADVTLGMGSSALRAMAFGKPVVVQGEGGFWCALTPKTLDQFLWTGWYGVGGGQDEGDSRLAAELQPLLHDAALRAELGEFSLATVRERFSLARAADLQLGVYAAAVARQPSTGLSGMASRAVETSQAAAGFAAHALRRKVARRLGRSARDDFNASPVAGQGGLAPSPPPDRSSAHVH